MRFSRFTFITFTVTIASPAVFTSTTHELTNDDTIELETSGALPTGLAIDTKYYVITDGITGNTFQVSTSKGGTAVVTTGSQSGVHKWIKTNRARLAPNVEDCK